MRDPIATAKRGLSKLLREHPFEIHFSPANYWMVAPGTFTLESPKCRVRIGFEFRGPVVDVIDVAADRPYYLPSIIAAQDPHYQLDGFLGLKDLNARVVIRALNRIEKALLTFCAPFLDGDFSGDLSKRVRDFENFFDANYRHVESLENSDPIKIKYKNGDVSWVEDLRNRLNAEAQDCQSTNVKIGRRKKTTDELAGPPSWFRAAGVMTRRFLASIAVVSALAVIQNGRNSVKKGAEKETKERRAGLRRRSGRGALQKGIMGKAKEAMVHECLAKGMPPKEIADLMLITVREVRRLAKGFGAV